MNVIGAKWKLYHRTVGLHFAWTFHRPEQIPRDVDSIGKRGELTRQKIKR